MVPKLRTAILSATGLNWGNGRSWNVHANDFTRISSHKISFYLVILSSWNNCWISANERGCLKWLGRCTYDNEMVFSIPRPGGVLCSWTKHTISRCFAITSTPGAWYTLHLFPIMLTWWSTWAKVLHGHFIIVNESFVQIVRQKLRFPSSSLRGWSLYPSITTFPDIIHKMSLLKLAIIWREIQAF